MGSGDCCFPLASISASMAERSPSNKEQPTMTINKSAKEPIPARIPAKQPVSQFSVASVTAGATVVVV